jgi:hypothetical protein
LTGVPRARQAKALKLDQQRKSGNAQLLEATRLLNEGALRPCHVSTHDAPLRRATGLPPTEEAEHEWYRMVRAGRRGVALRPARLTLAAMHRSAIGSTANRQWRTAPASSATSATTSRCASLFLLPAFLACLGSPLSLQAVGAANLRTMAEPRPNAYIPDDVGAHLAGARASCRAACCADVCAIGIPKPYGGILAPFKPTPLGSTMRHIRKPNPRPIEL